ncbi:hypothetical protein Smp_192260 [Schistosoma mansoni]|nr:hypothetical protein Smp_192260 [Schistosoma mansoni]|eukprot:XP_018653664.1 hypothetical protein Smp_192260 [Schistosoma mansoni]
MNDQQSVQNVRIIHENKNSANNMTVSEVPRQATEKIAVDSSE